MNILPRSATEKIPAVPAIFLAWSRRPFAGRRVGGLGSLLLLGVMLLNCLVSLAPVSAQEQGAGCYATAFQPNVTGHDPVNAYLLMLSCYYSYGNNLGAKDFADFSRRFREHFSRLGMIDFDFLDVREKTADTQVMIMSNQALVIVVFRGSEGLGRTNSDPEKALRDWLLTDLNVFKKSMPWLGTGVRVHRGFYNAVDVVYPQLRDLCRKHLGFGNTRRLWIAGHSLGAGLAPLAALRLFREDDVPVQGVVTYAAPRIGNKEFAKVFRTWFSDAQRWVNDRDLCAVMPFKVMGYEHAGPPNNIHADGTVKIADSPFTGPGKVASHAPAKYLYRLYQVLSREQKQVVPAPPLLN